MKLKNTRFFWVFALLFTVCLLAVPIGAMLMLNYVTVEMGAELSGIGLNDLPLFDFVDIWQNLSYLYKWPAILLAFIPVISMANEYRYGTIKQNIIDGLSRNELLLSKILFSAVLSVVFGLALLLIGLGMGFTYSPVTGVSYILKHVDYVFAFIIVLFGYQLFCLFITTLIKKSGITILLILFYFFALEAIAYGVIAWIIKCQN